MSGRTVEFDDVEPNRSQLPQADVVLMGPGGPHGAGWGALAIMDTGADISQLPSEAAAGVGIEVGIGPTVVLATAGGLVHRHRVRVDILIQGVDLTVDVDFAPGVRPLIGRSTMFALMDSVGFEPSEWLMKWR